MSLVDHAARVGAWLTAWFWDVGHRAARFRAGTATGAAALGIGGGGGDDEGVKGVPVVLADCGASIFVGDVGALLVPCIAVLKALWDSSVSARAGNRESGEEVEEARRKGNRNRKGKARWQSEKEVLKEAKRKIFQESRVCNSLFTPHVSRSSACPLGWFECLQSAVLCSLLHA